MKTENDRLAVDIARETAHARLLQLQGDLLLAQIENQKLQNARLRSELPRKQIKK